MKHSLILCPLPLELDAILSRLKEKKFAFTTEQVGPMRVFSFPDLKLKLSLAGHGKTQFGIQTQYLLKHYSHIASVFCAGCAGGLDERLSVFDVVVAEKTVEHDYRLRFAVRPLPEFSGDADLLGKFSQTKADGFKIHLGPIASGDEDVIDPVRSKEIKLQTGALAVAWEGAGGARACKFNNTPFVEIRGVTDTANNTASVDFSTNLKVAMANVCDSILSVLN